MLADSNPRRWFVVFWLTLGVWIGSALWSTSRLASFRDPPLDFYAMSPKQVFVVDGLTRRQEGSVKLGFAEAYAPPEIGLYGNHIFRFFGNEAFDRPGDPSYFFNYWFANLGLPEIYRYLRHLEQLRRLPTKLILVQITSPNIDNGGFIINFGNELPPDLLLVDTESDSLFDKMSLYGTLAWQVIENRLHETLNYANFILGIFGNNYKDRVFVPTACQPGAADVLSSGLVARAPSIVQDLLENSGIRHDYCQRADLGDAIQRDGSNDARYLSPSLIRNENPLKETERGLNAGDENEIAHQMRAIDAIGSRNGVKVVFILPPAFESNRDDSVVNEVFNRGLAMVPEPTVIDDRRLHNDPALFMDYQHPSPRYFHVLVDELRDRGLVVPTSTSPQMAN